VYLVRSAEYALRGLDTAKLHAVFERGDPAVPPAETREFLSDTVHALRQLIEAYCRPAFLPPDVCPPG
jgi:hypothetical protein